jgi:serine/threonine-protein kinase
MEAQMKNRTTGKLWIQLAASMTVLTACSQFRSTTVTSPAATQPASPGQNRIRAQDEMTMVFVPAGRFIMGSTEEDYRAGINQCRQYYEICNVEYFSREAPHHPVSLSAFWIDQTEVTNAQYQRCIEQGGCEAQAVCDEGHQMLADGFLADHPRVCVDWAGANEYCLWVGGRLPTEAEWEYAYRGPQGFIYPWGDEFDGTRLNYCDQNCPESHADGEFDDGYTITAPVGSFPNGASWVGALDMAGNVFEWVGDWFGPFSPEPQSDPLGPVEGTLRVMRGGTWSYHAARTRGAARDAVPPETRFDSVGFRCVVPFTP